MARNSKTTDVLESLLEMAERYGVADNAMFKAAAAQYALQQRVIASINAALDEQATLLASKEYVKGCRNDYAHPLVKELPKHADSANRTASAMLDIIKSLGHEKISGSRLEKLMDE